MDIHIAKVHDVLAGEKTHGTLVLVDRLWPRGVSKDDLQPDLWLKEVAPSTELRRWFGHDPARFDEFARRYRAELGGARVDKLIDAATPGPITLLYAAKDRQHNHAVVLRDWLIETCLPK